MQVQQLPLRGLSPGEEIELVHESACVQRRQGRCDELVGGFWKGGDEGRGRYGSDVAGGHARVCPVANREEAEGRSGERFAVVVAESEEAIACAREEPQEIVVPRGLVVTMAAS